MSLRIYKANRLLWIIASLVCLLLSSYDVQCIFGLFSGDSQVADLVSFEFVAPLIFAVVMGWLAQCAIVIVFSWRRGNAKH